MILTANLHSKKKYNFGSWRSGWPRVIWSLVIKLIIAYLGWKGGATTWMTLQKIPKGTHKINRNIYHFLLLPLWKWHILFKYVLSDVCWKTPYLIRIRSVSELPIQEVKVEEDYKREHRLCQYSSYIAVSFFFPWGGKKDKWCTPICIYHDKNQHNCSQMCDNLDQSKEYC